ncbi:hypothetical protein BDB01DRAFT_90251 [Pilobolus umbonatus]|nr:hypothetical protein BDB01DRAFT_90251 [Pilobolus umbonatus]
MESYTISPKCKLAMLVGAGIGAVALGAFSVGLAMLGFGALGPVGGSFAAWIQSVIGAEVAAGAAFALLQSIGMAGVGISTGIVVTGSTDTLAFAICNALPC